MSVLTVDERYRRRLQVAVSFTGSLVLTLAWGCVLVYAVGYGSFEVCEGYGAGGADGVSRALAAWCDHKAWNDLRGQSLLAAMVALVAGLLMAMWKPGRWWVTAGWTTVACACLWVGFALPQVLAGA